MKTIARNSKRRSQMFDSAKSCKCFCLSNGFSGEPCSVGWVRSQYEKFSFAKMRDHENGSISVKLHSNEWYELVF